MNILQFIALCASYAIRKTALCYIVSDKAFLKCSYYGHFGRRLDLANPKTYNEKLQWLKLNDRREDYVKMVDKYGAKEYVREKLGEEYIIPTLGVWDRFEDIDFSKLPDKFVLKCTHDSGGIVICNDKSKLDIAAAKKKINKSLKRNYFYHGREWSYKYVKPRIIAEQFMSETDGSELKDYKFMCFNGVPEMTLVCSDRYTETGLHMTFFDRDWNILPFERCHPRVDGGIEKPENYELMLELAAKLAEGMPFARIDFYDINGKVYFGEITLYPASGNAGFQPEEWDYKIGEMIDLSKVKH